MGIDGVEIACSWCGMKRLICQACWRGQRYCGATCQTAARAVQIDRARRDYAISRKGRASQRKRQRRYRLKLADDTRRSREESVTDQSTGARVTERILHAEPHDVLHRKSTDPGRATESGIHPGGLWLPAGRGGALRFTSAPLGAVCAECGAPIRRLLVGRLPAFLSLRAFG